MGTNNIEYVVKTLEKPNNKVLSMVNTGLASTWWKRTKIIKLFPRCLKRSKKNCDSEGSLLQGLNFLLELYNTQKVTMRISFM